MISEPLLCRKKGYLLIFSKNQVIVVIVIENVVIIIIVTVHLNVSESYSKVSKQEDGEKNYGKILSGNDQARLSDRQRPRDNRQRDRSINRRPHKTNSQLYYETTL